MTVSVGVERIGVVSATLLLILWAGTSSHAQSPAAAAAEISKLRILYAGRPGSDREKDFVGFLKKYFEVVQTGNAETFTETDTRGFDVTLLDGRWSGTHESRPMISESFSRPLMTLGVPGALICSDWRLKIGHL